MLQLSSQTQYIPLSSFQLSTLHYATQTSQVLQLTSQTHTVPSLPNPPSSFGTLNDTILQPLQHKQTLFSSQIHLFFILRIISHLFFVFFILKSRNGTKKKGTLFHLFATEVMALQIVLSYKRADAMVRALSLRLPSTIYMNYTEHKKGDLRLTQISCINSMGVARTQTIRNSWHGYAGLS